MLLARLGPVNRRRLPARRSSAGRRKQKRHSINQPQQFFIDSAAATSLQLDVGDSKAPTNDCYSKYSGACASVSVCSLSWLIHKVACSFATMAASLSIDARL